MLLSKIFSLVKLIVFECRNVFSHEECYITCSGKKDGAGAQVLAVMSTMLFAEVNHLKYIHTPFVKLQHNYENDIEWERKWENFFNLGMGELKIGERVLKINHEIYLDEDPLIIRKQANTLYLVRHCHEFIDLFPNQYSRIKDRLVDKYYGSSKSSCDLNYDLEKVNIAVHIRRGDVNGNNQFWDKFTENRYISNVLSKILEIIISQGLEPSVCVYSEGEKAGFLELERFNPKFYLNISPFTTFHNLVCADVLLLSKSTFSYSAALLSNGIVFYESFKHRPQNGWIKINRQAKFDTKVFSKKLRQNLAEHQRFIYNYGK
jgi:hypothetical protein